MVQQDRSASLDGAVPLVQPVVHVDFDTMAREAFDDAPSAPQALDVDTRDAGASRAQNDKNTQNVVHVQYKTRQKKQRTNAIQYSDSTESTQVVRGARRSSVAVSRKRLKRYAGVYKRRCGFRRVCYAKKHENRQHCVCSFVFAVAPSFARNMTMDVLVGNAIDFAKVTAETTYKADGGVTNCDCIAHFITAGCLFLHRRQLVYIFAAVLRAWQV